MNQKKILQLLYVVLGISLIACGYLYVRGDVLESGDYTISDVTIQGKENVAPQLWLVKDALAKVKDRVFFKYDSSASELTVISESSEESYSVSKNEKGVLITSAPFPVTIFKSDSASSFSLTSGVGVPLQYLCTQIEKGSIGLHRKSDGADFGVQNIKVIFNNKLKGLNPNEPHVVVGGDPFFMELPLGSSFEKLSGVPYEIEDVISIEERNSESVGYRVDKQMQLAAIKAPAYAFDMMQYKESLSKTVQVILETDTCIVFYDDKTDECTALHHEYDEKKQLHVIAVAVTELENIAQLARFYKQMESISIRNDTQSIREQVKLVGSPVDYSKLISMDDKEFLRKYSRTSFESPDTEKEILQKLRFDMKLSRLLRPSPNASDTRTGVSFYISGEDGASLLDKMGERALVERNEAFGKKTSEIKHDYADVLYSDEHSRIYKVVGKTISYVAIACYEDHFLTYTFIPSEERYSEPLEAIRFLRLLRRMDFSNIQKYNEELAQKNLGAYASVQSFGEPPFGFVVENDEGMHGVVDSEGKLIVPIQFERIELDFPEFPNGYVTTKKYGEFGFYSLDGQNSVPAKFQEVRWVDEGRVIVQNNDTPINRYRYGLYDSKNKKYLIPSTLSELKYDPVAKCYIGEKGRITTVFDVSGEKLVEGRFSEITSTDDYDLLLRTAETDVVILRKSTVNRVKTIKR